MPRFITYSCPDCDGIFRWLRHPDDEPPPNFCPLCGSCVNPDAVFAPAAPHIGKSIGRTGDSVYRQMEQAGQDHMHMAAEIAGGQASDYQGLNLTDMPDYLRPGDIAAKISDNPVTQAMAATPGGGGFQGFSAGSGFAAATTQGAFPRRGEQTRQYLTSSHEDRARLIESTGKRG